jgi:transposase
MTPEEIRSAARTLSSQGNSLRQIARLLKLSRNTVRAILREPALRASKPAAGGAVPTAWLEDAFGRAGGNAVRVQQLLAEERGQAVSYSSLKRWIREAQLRAPPRRSGEFHFGPGEESQHDTSPHRVDFTDRKKVLAQCAGHILACSRRVLIQYYPTFKRFEAKVFLLEAARFNDGTCPRCIIDNTSVMIASGAGADAVIAPEMAAFARTLGFEFRAHAVGNPDRKGRIERIFAWVESNFLPGRTFTDFDDLNRQALIWCREVANQKPKRALGMSPEAAYLIEKPYLQALPSVLPPVYEVFERVVDLYGFVSVDTNRYSVPERLIGQTLSVYKYPAEIQILRRGELIATHPRMVDKRDGKHTLPGHHTTSQRAPRAPALEERLLRGQEPLLDRYLDALKQYTHGRALRQLRRLVELKRTYPAAPFHAALEQALHFGLFDLGRLEVLILKQVAGDFFELAGGDDDP